MYQIKRGDEVLFREGHLPVCHNRLIGIVKDLLCDLERLECRTKKMEDMNSITSKYGLTITEVKDV